MHTYTDINVDKHTDRCADRQICRQRQTYRRTHVAEATSDGGCPVRIGAIIMRLPSFVVGRYGLLRQIVVGSIWLGAAHALLLGGDIQAALVHTQVLQRKGHKKMECKGYALLV